MESWYRLKVQEIQTQSARQTMEQGYAKEEVKRLRTQLADLRGKLADLESRVSNLLCRFVCEHCSPIQSDIQNE